MNEQSKEFNPDLLESCLKQLLRSHPPVQCMPEAVRARISSDLAVQSTNLGEPYCHRFFLNQRNWREPKFLIPVAAALLVLVAYLSWLNRSPNMVVWADVLKDLQKVKSMKCLHLSTTISPRGVLQTSASYGYFRYPECWRLDFFREPPPDNLNSFDIKDFGKLIDKIATVWKTPDQSVASIIYVREKRGIRTIEHYVDSGKGWPKQNISEDVYRDLLAVASCPAHRFETRTLDGVQVDGFELSASTIPWKSEFTRHLNGVCRVWISTKTMLPIEVEFEFESDGEHILERWKHITWNEPIPDNVFLSTSFQDLTITEAHNRIYRRMFDKNRLKPGIVFLVISEEGKKMVSSDDVLNVDRGVAIYKESSKNPEYVWICFQLDKEAYQRLGLNENLDITFDGHKLTEVRGNPRWERSELTVDIKSLGLTIEQFEKTYLTEETNFSSIQLK